MKFPGFGLGLLVVSVLLFCQAARAATIDVDVLGMSFSPNPVTIQAGNTVRWTWNSNNHSVRSGRPAQPNNLFSSGIRDGGDVFTHTFPTPGNFPYFCEVHGSMMTSAVNVLPPADTDSDTNAFGNAWLGRQRRDTPPGWHRR